MNYGLKSAIASALVVISFGATVSCAQSFSDYATDEDKARIEAMQLNPLTEAAAKEFAGAFRLSEEQAGRVHPDLTEPQPTGVDDRAYKEYRLSLMQQKRDAERKRIQEWALKNHVKPVAGATVVRKAPRAEVLARTASMLESDPAKQADLYSRLEKAAEEDYDSRMEDLASDLSGEPPDYEFVTVDSLFGKGHHPKTLTAEDPKGKGKAKDREREKEKARKLKQAKEESDRAKAEKAAAALQKAKERALAKEKAIAEAKAKREAREAARKQKALERERKKQQRLEEKEAARRAKRAQQEERKARKLLKENGIKDENIIVVPAKEGEDPTLKLKEVFRKTETEEIKNEVWNPQELINKEIPEKPSTTPPAEQGAEVPAVSPKTENEPANSAKVPGSNDSTVTPISMRILNFIGSAYAATRVADDVKFFREEAYRLSRENQERNDSKLSESEQLEKLGIALPDVEKYQYEYQGTVTQAPKAQKKTS